MMAASANSPQTIALLLKKSAQINMKVHTMFSLVWTWKPCDQAPMLRSFHFGLHLPKPFIVMLMAEGCLKLCMTYRSEFDILKSTQYLRYSSECVMEWKAQNPTPAWLYHRVILWTLQLRLVG